MRPLHCRFRPRLNVVPLVAATAAVLALGGCAHLERETYTRSRAAEVSYAQPLPDLWKDVAALMRDKGYTFREDPNSYTLETEWKEQIRGSQLTGAWKKYVAVGRQLPDGRSIVRFYFNEKAAAGNERAGRSVLWSPVLKEGIGPAEDIQRDSTEARSSLRLGVRNSDAHRDLELEWELLQRVDPVAAGQINEMAKLSFGERRAAAELALKPTVATPVETGAASDASVAAGPITAEASKVMEGDCGASIPGFAHHVTPGAILLLGEQPHGTEEIPRFVGAVACQIALTGLPVSVGLELPANEQKLVDRYFTSEGTPQDQELLMQGRSWYRPYQDGRTSRAMLELIESLRGLKQKGLPVSVFFIDEPALAFDARDAQMAKHVLERALEVPESVLLVLTGNVHARTEKGTPWARDFEPMGYLLAERYGQVVSLDAAFADGTSWVCRLSPAIDCGVRRARGRYNGSQVFVHQFSVPSRDGFLGFYYVGPVTASPPAVANGQDGPTSASKATSAGSPQR